MINRTMVRTRVVQNLFAYYKDSDNTPHVARKQLLKSFSSTYNLYMVMLDLCQELRRYADDQISASVQRAKVTHMPYEPNRAFVDNQFAQQLFNNRMLRHFLNEQHLSWDAGLDAVAVIYRQLVEKPYYQEYMAANEHSYAEDKRLWRKIYEDLLVNNEALLSALDDMEIALDESNWTTDVNVVLSYVVKTIKGFEQSAGNDQELLQMFDNEEELQFGTRLLQASIDHCDEYEQMVNAHLKGWDADRIASMDRVILQVALAEIMTFDEIALEVTLNEYLELAKEYSSDKSHIFINGILNEILHEMKDKHTLLKAMTIK